MNAMILNGAVAMIGSVLVALTFILVAVIAGCGAGVCRGSSVRIMMNCPVPQFPERGL